MSSLSKMHRLNRFRRARSNRDPLRKVVGLEPLDPPADLWSREILECDHRQRPREDFIGRMNAIRRRCWQCGRSGLLRKLVGVGLLAANGAQG